MRTFLWVKKQGVRLAVWVTKAFLSYFLYTAARKIFRPASDDEATEKQEEPSPCDEGGEKKDFVVFEEPILPTYENRRIVALGGSNTFVFYLRCLRDGFPDDERLRFSWGGFQADGSSSFFLLSDCLKKKRLLFTIENPILGRRGFDDIKTRDEGYFRVALYDSAMFHRGIFNLPAQADATRFHKILQTTHTTLEPYRKKGEHIIYALQVPYDRSLVGLDMFVAAQYDLVALRMRTSRKIIVTVNPAMIRELWASGRLKDEVSRSYEYLKKLCRALDIEVYDNFSEQGKDSSQFFRNCWCLVCHSSGVAVDAMLAGVPAVTLHPASFVYPICSHDLNEVDNPKMPNRTPWFSRLAYCQWTLAEIARGDVWRHFQPKVESLLEKK